jgi:hypothetical protein
VRSTSVQQSLVQRLWEDAKQRPARLRPGSIPVPLEVLAILTWLGAATVLAFDFVPGLFTPEETSLYGGALTFEYAPFWPLLCGVALGSAVAAVGYTCTATDPGGPRHHVALAWGAGIATPLIPVLVLAIDRGWQTVPAALAWLTAAMLVIRCVHLRRRAPGPWTGVLLAGLVAAPWIPAVYANIRLGSALDTTPRDESAVLDLLVADLPAKTYVPGIALAFVAAMATAGVAIAAHSRAAVAHQISRHRAGWRISAVIGVLAVGVIALEVSGFAGISSGFLDTYWDLGELWTWPHAVLVAAAITAVTRRSFDTPLVQRGDVATTLAIGVSTLCGHIVIALAMVVNLVASAIIGPTNTLIGPPPGLELVIAWLAMATLVPVAIGRRWRATVGRSVARVSLLFLVPVYLGVTGHALGLHWPISFWAKAPQVAICLTVIGCVATLFGLAGKRSFLSPEMANRLVLIPLLIVSGASWLPNVIATPLTPVIAVTAALFALLWALPPDEEGGHTGVVLTVSAQLLLVGAAAGVVALLPDVSGDDPVLALLLFSVPLTTLLCAHVGSD